jgi:rubrerythrin
MKATDLTKFEMAEAAERLAGEIYLGLAQRFAADSKSRDLFKQLASEEEQHAMRVSMLRTQYFNAKVADIQLDVESLAFFLDQGAALKKKIAGDSALTLGQALTLMAEFETNFSGAHAEMMLSAADPDLKKFFEQFAAQDKLHAQLLKATQ